MEPSHKPSVEREIEKKKVWLGHSKENKTHGR